MKRTHHSKDSTLLKVLAGVLIVLLLASFTIGAVSADTPTKRVPVGDRTIERPSDLQRGDPTERNQEIARNQDSVITELGIRGITAPVFGETADLSVDTVPAQVTVSYVSWNADKGSSIVSSSSDKTFKDGVTYTLGITVKANEGYVFSENLKVYQLPSGGKLLSELSSYPELDVGPLQGSDDGKAIVITKTFPMVIAPVLVSGTTAGTETFYGTETVYTGPEEITELGIRGITAPVYGETADLSVDTVPAQVTVSYVSWNPDKGSSIVSSSSDKTFKDGVTYTLGITVKANEGYVFSENLKVYQLPSGGKLMYELSSYPELDVGPLQGSDDGKAIVITKTFPMVTSPLLVGEIPVETETGEIDVEKPEETEKPEEVEKPEETEKPEKTDTTGKSDTSGKSDAGKPADEGKTAEPEENPVAQFFKRIFAIFGFA